MASMHKTPSEDGKQHSSRSKPTLNLSTTDIVSTLKHLELSSTIPQKTAHAPKSKPVADSWEEESDGSDTETDEPSATKPREALAPILTVKSNDLSPHPPPPTPASPTQFDYADSVPFGRSRGDSSGATGGGTGLEKRPEKTTAVAGRLIAGALGVRAPKRTDEEKEYDRVMREKERKRRTEEKERERREKEETEARKKAIWDD